jgi:hypothetical protein
MSTESFPALRADLENLQARYAHLLNVCSQIQAEINALRSDPSVYDPQGDVASIMRAWDQEVRTKPKMIESKEERKLTANLIFEEALEFVAGMGFYPENMEGIPELIEVSEPDMVEAADALGDLQVVTYGGYNRLGIRARGVFQAVHKSNQTKVGKDGKVIRRESDNKVLKPATYEPPDIYGELIRQGWEPPIKNQDSLQQSSDGQKKPASLDGEDESCVSSS